jgi:hypothetical protein
MVDMKQYCHVSVWAISSITDALIMIDPNYSLVITLPCNKGSVLHNEVYEAPLLRKPDRSESRSMPFAVVDPRNP